MGDWARKSNNAWLRQSAGPNDDHDVLEGERGLIDHIASTPDLKAAAVNVWPGRHPNYRNGTREVTDHEGSAADSTYESSGLTLTKRSFENVSPTLHR